MRLLSSLEKKRLLAHLGQTLTVVLGDGVHICSQPIMRLHDEGRTEEGRQAQCHQENPVLRAENLDQVASQEEARAGEQRGYGPGGHCAGDDIALLGRC